MPPQLRLLRVHWRLQPRGGSRTVIVRMQVPRSTRMTFAPLFVTSGRPHSASDRPAGATPSDRVISDQSKSRLASAMLYVETLARASPSQAALTGSPR
jgi:hypothetical protein